MHATSILLALLASVAVAQPHGGFGGFGGGGFGGGSQSGSQGGGSSQGGSSSGGQSSSGSSSGSSGQSGDSGSGSQGQSGGSTSGGSTSGGSTSGGSSSGGSSGGSGGQLDPKVICTGCASDGQQDGAEAGQSPSLTSKENFVNFCVGQDGGPSQFPITNGQQIKTGSCNPVPMGFIASTNNMPSSKFISPKNLDTIQANQDFTVQLSINHLTTGTFTNPNVTYYSAPCQPDGNGDIIGHSHITIQQVDSLTTTNAVDPSDFTFFKGINTAAQNGILSVDVAGGLDAGTYRMGSINACSNHQPVLVAVAQRGYLDDVVYFTVGDAGQGGQGGQGSSGGSSSGGSSGSSGSTGSSSGGSSSGSSGSSQGGSSQGSSSQGGSSQGGSSQGGSSQGGSQGASQGGSSQGGFPQGGSSQGGSSQGGGGGFGDGFGGGFGGGSQSSSSGGQPRSCNKRMRRLARRRLNVEQTA